MNTSVILYQREVHKSNSPITCLKYPEIQQNMRLSFSSLATLIKVESSKTMYDNMLFQTDVLLLHINNPVNND